MVHPVEGLRAPTDTTSGVLRSGEGVREHVPHILRVIPLAHPQLVGGGRARAAGC